MMFWSEQGNGEKATLYRIWLIGAAVGAVALSGCSSKPDYPISAAPAYSERGDERTDRNDRDARERSSDESENASDESRLRTSTDQNNDWSDAFTAPLEDFNIRRQDIPPILAQAVTKPYDLAGLDTCDAIAAEVIKLDELLGQDFDEPPAPQDERTLGDKSKSFANNQAVGAVRSATRSIIPFRGVFRYVTGADKHQKALDNAIQAGKVRRAYLKGIGMNKNCAPPAAPSWFRPRVYVQTYVQPEKPAPEAKPAPKPRTAQKRR